MSWGTHDDLVWWATMCFFIRLFGRRRWVEVVNTLIFWGCLVYAVYAWMWPHYLPVNLFTGGPRAWMWWNEINEFGFALSAGFIVLRGLYPKIGYWFGSICTSRR